jgi:muramoyltetrapeptide carboxypeptidase
MIGLWTSSSPAPAGDVTRGLKALEPYVDGLIFPEQSRRWATKKESAGRSFLAGPDEAKVEAFVSLLRNPRVTDILSVRGGYGTLRLLPKLEKARAFRLAPKKLWGYSDMTSLQVAYWGRNGAPWVHSPMLSSASLGEPGAAERKAWREAFTATRGSQTHSLRTLKAPHHKPSSFLLPLIGGNLACLTALVGTPWEPKARPCLLFLEEINEAPYRVDRMLQQLASSAFFKGVRGVVLGQFTGCPKHSPVLRMWCQELNLPLVAGIRAGHDRPNLPLVMGEKVRLELGSQKTAELIVPKPCFG